MQPLVGTLYQLIDQESARRQWQFEGIMAPGVEKGRKGFATQESAKKSPPSEGRAME